MSGLTEEYQTQKYLDRIRRALELYDANPKEVHDWAKKAAQYYLYVKRNRSLQEKRRQLAHQHRIRIYGEPYLEDCKKVCEEYHKEHPKARITLSRAGHLLRDKYPLPKEVQDEVGLN